MEERSVNKILHKAAQPRSILGARTRQLFCAGGGKWEGYEIEND